MVARFLDDAKQQVLLAVAAVLLAIAVFLTIRALNAGPDYGISAERAFKCAECGHEFEHVIQIGDQEPMLCPKCGKVSAWVPETCYWTRDGKAKRRPTFVILKRKMGIDEDTFCPDCGREVVGHNPRPPKELMDAAEAE